MEGKKPKILLCEDDPNLGMVLKNYLELSDFDVTLERDGRLGLAAFQRERFDLCLLDIMMPHMDGFTLAEEIRDVDPDIPLFFLSAKTMKEDIIQGYKLGADDYITKPFDSEVLLLKIKAILKRNEDLNREAEKKIWGSDTYFNGRSMDVYIAKLRKYLKDDTKIEIVNIHGNGFRLVVQEVV